MVNQFFSGKLPDALIGKIANPQLSSLDQQSVIDALTPGVTEAQISSDRLKGSLPLFRLREQDSILEAKERSNRIKHN